VTAPPTSPARADALDSPEWRAELLAAAEPASLVLLADRVTATTPCRVLTQPRLGMVLFEVREPVAAERFHLAEVLVTEAEVELAGARGWSMRTGDDRLATLAAAVLDAAVEADHPLRTEVEDLCRTTAASLATAAAEQVAQVAATTVSFEELDR
jgi:alpha-D-ribose 1-methylphosphonate 5-triphosphate synthase subunit PhnG